MLLRFVCSFHQLIYKKRFRHIKDAGMKWQSGPSV